MVLQADHEVIATSSLVLDLSVFSSMHSMLHGVEQHQHFMVDATARAWEENERAKELLLRRAKVEKDHHAVEDRSVAVSAWEQQAATL